MKTKKTNPKMYLVISIILVIGVIIGLGINMKINPENYNAIINKNVNLIKYTPSNFDSISGISHINVPAVDSNGNGVITSLVVEATKGTGKTLIDIDSVLFVADTQSSIRTAKEVAAEYTGKDLNKYDLIYHLDTNASLIGGPSAGAALTIATISALDNQKIKDNVIITGSIESDGNIGEVGGIVDKAKAAKIVGADLFLVPLNQLEETVYEDRENCERIGLRRFCTIEQVPVTVNIQEAANITVKEVTNITEAYNYFVSNN